VRHYRNVNRICQKRDRVARKTFRGNTIFYGALCASAAFREDGESTDYEKVTRVLNLTEERFLPCAKPRAAEAFMLILAHIIHEE
jgi:hypothetical protein